MSWFPFVSRGRFEDAQATIARLQAEREKLWDRILSEAGLKPIFTTEQLERTVADVVSSTVRKDTAKPEEMPRRLSPMEISSQATAAMKKQRESLAQITPKS
jgi:hypothetical protein